jgi:hypothetical protein
VIPHTLLRSLFYPRTSPDLRIKFAPIERQEPQGMGEANVRERIATYVLRGSLSNAGNGSAHDMFATIETNYVSNWGGFDVFVERQTRGKRRSFVALRSIHPREQDVPCFHCVVKAPLMLEWAKPTPNVDQADRIIIKVSLFCKDAEPVDGTFEFDASSIRAALR